MCTSFAVPACAHSGLAGNTHTASISATSAMRCRPAPALREIRKGRDVAALTAPDRSPRPSDLRAIKISADMPDGITRGKQWQAGSRRVDTVYKMTVTELSLLTV